VQGRENLAVQGRENLAVQGRETLAVQGRENLAETGLSDCCKGTTSQHSEKSWEMTVNPDVDGFIKNLKSPESTPKYTKETATYWIPKEN